MVIRADKGGGLGASSLSGPVSSRPRSKRLVERPPRSQATVALRRRLGLGAVWA
jgi:hypothetical protein